MRFKLTKRRLWWTILAAIAGSILVVVVVVWDRGRQRNILEQAGFEFDLDEDTGPVRYHEPIFRFFYDIDSKWDTDLADSANRTLLLFATDYEISGREGEKPIDREKLPYLAGWPAVEMLSLVLEQPDLADADFQCIGSMPKLKHLELRGGNISGEVLPAIVRQAPGLQSLYIGDSPSFRGDHLDSLRFFEGAREPGIYFELGLFNVPVGDAAIETIVEHAPGTNQLRLRDTGISDAGIETLLKLEALEVLMIGGSKATNSGLHYDRFAGLKSLHSLQLDHGSLDGLRRLLATSMPHLTGLSLDGIPLTREDVEKIHAFAPNLRWLDLRGTGIDNGAIESLVPLVHLNYLGLSGNPAIDDRAEATLKRLRPTIDLNLAGTGLTIDALIRVRNR